jgi:hypothetical protein
VKANRREEFAIGWTDPERSRIGFGALVLGYSSQATGEFTYAGGVATNQIRTWPGTGMMKRPTCSIAAASVGGVVGGICSRTLPAISSSITSGGATGTEVATGSSGSTTTWAEPASRALSLRRHL